MERAEYEAMHAVEGRMWWYRGLRGLVCDLVDASRSGSGPLLDAGCGTGGMLQSLQARFPGRDLAGLEYDPLAARLASDKSRTPVAAGSIDRMPIRDRSIGTAVCLDVLSHGAVDPPLAVKELHRCLESGGILLLNVPAYRWMLSAHDRRVHNVRRFVRSDLRRLLQKAGLRPIRISHWNTFLFPLMVLHRLLTPQDAASDVRPYPALLNAAFSAILAVERGLIRMGLNLPFGGSIVAVAVKD